MYTYCSIYVSWDDLHVSSNLFLYLFRSWHLWRSYTVHPTWRYVRAHGKMINNSNLRFVVNWRKSRVRIMFLGIVLLYSLFIHPSSTPPPTHTLLYTYTHTYTRSHTHVQVMCDYVSSLSIYPSLSFTPSSILISSLPYTYTHAHHLLSPPPTHTLPFFSSSPLFSTPPSLTHTPSPSSHPPHSTPPFPHTHTPSIPSPTGDVRPRLWPLSSGSGQ